MRRRYTRWRFPHPASLRETWPRPPNGGHSRPRQSDGMKRQCSSRSGGPDGLRSRISRQAKGRHTPASSLAIGAVIVGLLVPATPASAQWGAPTPQPYCSSSVGCYINPATGKPVYTTLGPTLTAQERQWLGECELRLAGSGFAGAGGLAGRNWLAILGAAFNGGAALVGPCKNLWNSTARYRRG